NGLLFICTTQEAAWRQFETAGDAGQSGFTLYPSVGPLHDFRIDRFGHSNHRVFRNNFFGYGLWFSFECFFNSGSVVCYSAQIVLRLWCRSRLTGWNHLRSNHRFGGTSLLQFLLHFLACALVAPILEALPQGNRKSEASWSPDL